MVGEFPPCTTLRDSISPTGLTGFLVSCAVLGYNGAIAGQSVKCQVGARYPNGTWPTKACHGRRRRMGQVRTIVVVLVAVIVAVAGWWGIYQFWTRVWPEQPGAQLAFFLLLFLTLTCTLVPLAAILNHRFAPKHVPPSPWRILRHSAWGALCLTSFAWLQTYRAFNLGFAFIVALIFVAIEVYILRMGSDS